MARSVEPYQPARPPQRIDENTAIEKAEKHVRRSLKGYLRNIEKLGKGLLIVGPAPKGKPSRELILRDPETGTEESLGYGLEVFQTLPNLKALQYLADRAMGRPAQSMAITGDGGGPLEVVPWRPMTEAEAEAMREKAREHAEPDYIDGEGFVIGED